MRKIFVLALVALAMGACGTSQFDEQVENEVMLKGGKTEQVKVKPSKNERNGIMLLKSNKTETAKVKDPFARGKNKNEKNGIMPLDGMTTRSMQMYEEDGPIRRPLIDGDPVSDKPSNGGGSTQTSGRKSQSGPITKPLK